MWNGQGGDLINAGLPYCVAIDRKLENRWEIQDFYCRVSKFIMRLNCFDMNTDEETTGLLHGVEVLKDLVGH